MVDITQMVRVLVCGTKCCEFNSHYLPVKAKLFDMNYKKKKKLFQQLNFDKLQKNSNWIIFFQANSINSLNRSLLIKELNKLNLKLHIYQTKLLRQKKFIFEENFVKNVYSGLFLVLSTSLNNHIVNINNFFNLCKNFSFLLPICVIFLNQIIFKTQLKQISQIQNIKAFLIFLSLFELLTFLKFLKLKILV